MPTKKVKIWLWAFNNGVIRAAQASRDLMTPDDGLLIVVGNMATLAEAEFLKAGEAVAAAEGWRYSSLTAGLGNVQRLENFGASVSWVNLEPDVPGFPWTITEMLPQADMAKRARVGLTLTGRPLLETPNTGRPMLERLLGSRLNALLTGREVLGLIMASRRETLQERWDYGLLAEYTRLHIQTQTWVADSVQWLQALGEIKNQFGRRRLPLPIIQISIGSLDNGVTSERAAEALAQAADMGFEEAVIQFRLVEKEQPREFLEAYRALTDPLLEPPIEPLPPEPPVVEPVPPVV